MISALRLGFVTLIWLLALIPVALAALTVAAVKLTRRAVGRPEQPPAPYDDGH